MFDMFKPMLLAMLVSAADKMQVRAEARLQMARDINRNDPDFDRQIIVAYIWGDAARMIRESIAK